MDLRQKRAYMRIGAMSRRIELAKELALIDDEFPELAESATPIKKRKKAARKARVIKKARTRKPMTAKQKKEIGVRMRRYWAERRKAEK